MADDEGNVQVEAGGEQPADVQADARVIINTQYVKDLSFENPNAPQSLVDLRQGPNITMNIEVNSSPLAERRHEVVLSLNIKANVEERAAFVVELDFAGIVTLGERIPEDQMKPLLEVEVPRYLFPFARHIIAEITRQGGFPPLLINPIDFARLYMSRNRTPEAAPEVVQ